MYLRVSYLVSPFYFIKKVVSALGPFLLNLKNTMIRYITILGRLFFLHCLGFTFNTIFEQSGGLVTV